MQESKAGKQTPVLAFGDMNDDPWDNSLVIHALATRERGDVERGTSARFYNLSCEYLNTKTIDIKGKERVIDGSLYFNKNGNRNGFIPYGALASRASAAAVIIKPAAYINPCRLQPLCENPWENTLILNSLWSQ